MKILKKSRDNITTAELYKLTLSPEIGKFSDAVGQRVEIADYIIFDDDKVDDATGEVSHNVIFSISTPDGEVYASNSATLRKNFEDMAALFAENGETVSAINVCEGTAGRSGRKYVYCTYAG